MKYKILSEEETITVKKGVASVQIEGILFDVSHRIDNDLNSISEWLRDYQVLNINVRHIPHNQRYSFRITGSYHEGEAGLLNNSTFSSNESYYEALDKGVFEALKLIAEGRDIDVIRGLK